MRSNGEIKKLWTYNGIVHFKITDEYNERPKKIIHDSDFNKYFNNDKNNNEQQT